MSKQSVRISTGRILASAVLILLCNGQAFSQVELTPNPIADTIKRSSLTVNLEDFVTLPQTNEYMPFANLQSLKHAGDGSGLLYVNDTRGVIWLIEDGFVHSTPFLDLRDHNIGFEYDHPAKGLRSFEFHPEFEESGSPGYGKLYTVSTHTRKYPTPGRADF